MADRHDYYFGQLVAEDELDEGFAWLETADWNQDIDHGSVGVVYPRYTPTGFPPPSWQVSEQGPTAFGVTIKEGWAYDKLGRRMSPSPGGYVNLDCSVDYLGIPTAVVNPANEKYLSVFLKYKKLLLDPRTDDYGATVYFDQIEDYELEVRQGAEFLAGAGDPTVNGAPLDSEDLLLADILIDINTPAVGIQNADIDLYNVGLGTWPAFRFEWLVNIDMASVSPWPLPPGFPEVFVARNIQEVVYFMLNASLGLGATYFVDVNGFNKMVADFDPDVDCTYDMGAKDRWKTLFIQNIDERPDYAVSGRSEWVPDVDWMTSPSRAMSILKRWRTSQGGYFSEFMNANSRREKRYLNYRQDFLYSQSHLGPYDYRTQVTGTGAVLNNPFPHAQAIPNGFVHLIAPAGGDDALVFNDASPLHGDRDPQAEFIFQIVWPGTTGTELIYMGLRDPILGGFAYLVYDPSGLSPNPNPPNGNWWVWFYDGVLPPPGLWFDTLQGVGLGFFTSQHVTIEREPVGSGGKLWLRFYQVAGGLLLYEIDLTTGGFEASILSMAFDYAFYYGDSVGGGAGAYLDLVELKANREY